MRPSNCSARSMIRSCTTMSLSAPSSNGKRGMTRCESTRKGSLRAGSTLSANSSAVGTKAGQHRLGGGDGVGWREPRTRHQPSSSHCACSALPSTPIRRSRSRADASSSVGAPRCARPSLWVLDGSEACHTAEPKGRTRSRAGGGYRSSFGSVLPTSTRGHHCRGHLRGRSGGRPTTGVQAPPPGQARGGPRRHHWLARIVRVHLSRPLASLGSVGGGLGTVTPASGGTGPHTVPDPAPATPTQPLR